MVCSRVRNQLSAYVDQELTGREALALRRHLDECPACRAEYRAVRQVKWLYAALPASPPAAPGSWRGLDALHAARAARARPAPRWWNGSLGRWAAACGLAVGCLALVATLLVIRQANAPNPMLARTRPTLHVGSEPGPSPVLPAAWQRLSPGFGSGWPGRDPLPPHPRRLPPEGRLVTY